MADLMRSEEGKKKRDIRDLTRKEREGRKER
jgi:hypothetical protein